MEKVMVEEMEKLVPHVMKISRRMWIDYDKKADVLYISFERPQRASDSELLDNGIIVRKRNGKIVGLTVLHASKFGLNASANNIGGLKNG